MKESKALERLLNDLKNIEDKRTVEMTLVTALGGSIYSESLLLDATIDYMLAHKKENDPVENFVVDQLVDKLVDRKEMLKIITNFLEE